MSVSEWYLVGRRGVGGEAEETGLRCWVEEKLRVQAGSACVFPVVIATSGGTHHERQNTDPPYRRVFLAYPEPC